MTLNCGNVCTDLKFRGWYKDDNDLCYESKLYTPDDLVDILKHCGVCCATVSKSQEAVGGGICVVFGVDNFPTNSARFFRSRDGKVIKPDGSITSDMPVLATLAPNGALLELTVTNESDSLALAVISCWSIAQHHLNFDDNILREGMYFCFSDNPDLDVPTFMGGANGLRYRQSDELLYHVHAPLADGGQPAHFGDGGDGFDQVLSSGAQTQYGELKYYLEPGEAKTFYGQWWFGASKTQEVPATLAEVVHGTMHMGYTLFYNAIR